MLRTARAALTRSSACPRVTAKEHSAAHGGTALSRGRLAIAGIAVLLAACGSSPEPHPASVPPDIQGNTAPADETLAENARVAEDLPLGDPQDFDDARRGLIAGDGDVVVSSADGTRIWDTTAYAFIGDEAPPSVNPSLWRQAKLNAIHGLFRVVDGVYQVRGYDLANMTLIQGKSGWIVVDPLTARETAAAALDLARRFLGDQPVVALIFTHSHVDHFGGVAGVLPDDPAQRAALRIIAPSGFVEAATSENVLAGIAMGRRASFMYGIPLARTERGHVDTGLGKDVARGGIDMVEPTELVDHTPQPMEIDGVRFVFQYAPESEAPAELTFYLPELRAYCGAEIVTHNLHNLYTLRGAKIRDALRWSGYIDDALHRFPDAEVVFASHHWPVWGRARVADYLERQRDAYKYLHDQTLRLANQGATPQEIAECLELPPVLRDTFAMRDYYGTVRHNAKAIYQQYFGWYDGNPAHLDPLPPADAAVRYVDAMGGSAEVLRKGREAFDRGEYRWAATLLDHLVFAQPENQEAREQLARTYDQLGYQAESGPWRDIYLTGALELRRGVQGSAVDLKASAGLLRHMPPTYFFQSMAARVDGPRALDTRLTLNFIFTDLNESYVLSLKHGVLHHRPADPDPQADASVRLTRDFLVKLATGQAGLRDMLFSDDLHVEGSRMALFNFFRLLDQPDGRFAIVTP